VATASGMSAILAVCMGLLEAGDHIVASRSLFGSTTLLFNKYLVRFGIETSYVPLDDLDAWDRAIRPRTRLLFCETPSNPLTEIVDIRRLAEVAHRRGCLLAVDNCFCTPALQRPLEQGADLVIHSATKYLDGQGRCVGGAVVGDDKLVGESVFGVLRTAGPTMSPFNAWVFLKGLETLELRMLAHVRAAAALAEWLLGQPGVGRVYYPGLPDHPQHHLVGAQQRTGGGVVAFDVIGGRDGAWHLIDSTRLLSITANLGDTKTTITHPATTTHGRLTPEEREAVGIGEGLVRVAVGSGRYRGHPSGSRARLRVACGDSLNPDRGAQRPSPAARRVIKRPPSRNPSIDCFVPETVDCRIRLQPIALARPPARLHSGSRRYRSGSGARASNVR
jgi:O-succinylhomoserine sulfhydrylase